MEPASFAAGEQELCHEIKICFFTNMCYTNAAAEDITVIERNAVQYA